MAEQLTREEQLKRLAALTPEEKLELAKLVKKQIDKGEYTKPEEEKK